MNKNHAARKENKTEKSTSKKNRIICAACAAAALIIIFAAADKAEEGEKEAFMNLTQKVIFAEALLNYSEQTSPPEPIEFDESDAPENAGEGLAASDRYIDFDALNERNGDVIGWISVEGTQIDYPILRSKDNYDYLVADIDGEENINGSIFIDMGNAPDFSDRNTVIYGHNMKNGSMFAGLHNFEDEEFFNENREIKIYTRDGMRVYEIVAAYLTNDENILYANNFSDDDVWFKYTEDMLTNENGNIKAAEIGLDDRIITLSTCQRGEDDRRYLVAGILKREKEE